MNVISRAGWARLLGILALLCVVATAVARTGGAAPAKAATLPPAPIRYTMTVDVDYDKYFLNVTQIVSYTNRSTGPLASILFNVAPAAFGAFNLTSASVDGSLVTHEQDRALLTIPCPQPLAPNDTALVTLRWWGQLPASDGRYGASDGVLVLGNWYPMVAVLENGNWERHQYTAIGDAFYSDIADYDVTVNITATAVVASSIAVAASGPQVSHSGSQWVFRAQNARDFAMGLSSSFKTVTRKVDDTTISVYYYGDREEAARTTLDVADQAMRWYNKKIGAYPYPTLAIVQIPNRGQHVAQEHAGLFTLRTDIFTPGAVGIYAAHELAHAWFFGAVGDDQIREPWMDEGLVDSVSLEFYRETFPKDFPGVWGSWGGESEDFRNTLPLNRGIYDFDNGSVYFFTVYRQGAAFFTAVRRTMGDDAYWAALQTYYKEYSLRIARPRDLLRVLRKGAGSTDLMPVFRAYLDYSYLKYANLAVDIGAPDGQTWDGEVAVPIYVSADCPTYTLSVSLDGTVISTTTRPVTILVSTAPMTDGLHTLAVWAEDVGINRGEAQRTFRVHKPTPTPTVTATPTTTPTRPPLATAGAPTRTLSPLATATATPPGQDSGTPAPWGVFLLAAAVVFGVIVTVVRVRGH